MRDFSKSFKSVNSGYIGKLNLDDSQLELLHSAKLSIQNHLRDGIQKIVKSQLKVDLIPRFLSQGSSVYKTQNKPCQNPPQQIDYDLGCYLPLSFLDQTHPSIASEVFFEIVDNLLEDLVEKMDWYSIDKTKKTCSRVIVNQEVHIDVPLYSIPDKEFDQIRKSISEEHLIFSGMRINSILEDEWNIIKHRVLLAHRAEGWISSDPRKLNKYFTDVFSVKGEQLRRICRYLKGWRDYKWKTGGPSSIYLMILADSIYESELDSRDDISFKLLLEEFSEKLKYPVKNPADENEILTIEDDDLKKLVEISKEFAHDLNDAIYNSKISSSEACNIIRRNLGNRFPLNDNIPFDDSNRKKVLKTPITTNDHRKPNPRGRAG